MINPIANLFLSLQAQITALVDGSGNTYFKYVDQDLGQLENHNGDMRPPVMWPCVLIDIENETYKSLGENIQEGKLTVCLRIGFPPFSATSAATPVAYIQKAIYYYDLQQVLHQALQGVAPGYIVDGADLLANVFGSYTHISAETEKRNDFIRVRVIKYTLGMDDFSTQNQPTLVPAALDLNADFTFPA